PARPGRPHGLRMCLPSGTAPRPRGRRTGSDGATHPLLAHLPTLSKNALTTGHAANPVLEDMGNCNCRDRGVNGNCAKMAETPRFNLPGWETHRGGGDAVGRAARLA